MYMEKSHSDGQAIMRKVEVKHRALSRLTLDCTLVQLDQ